MTITYSAGHARRRDLGGRAGTAWLVRRLEELREYGDVDPEEITGRGGDAVAINAVKDELLTAARNAVAQGRSQSGTGPTIADRALRRLDTPGKKRE